MSEHPHPVPKPRNLSSSSSEGSKSIDNSMRALKIDNDQSDAEIHRLQGIVYELRQEEERLMDHIASLKQEEEQMGLNFAALKAKDQELSDWEQDLSMLKSRIDSGLSDKESELRQRERELQHLEDQLHMKNKDLKQREFDIMNADSATDLNSSQLTELADRQYELDRREEELKYREERMREWSMSLREKENDYRKRFEDLLQREACFYSKSAHSGSIPDSKEQYTSVAQHQQHAQQIEAYATQQQVNLQSSPGIVSQTQQRTSNPNPYAQQHYAGQYPREQTDRGGLRQHSTASSSNDVESTSSSKQWVDRHHAHTDLEEMNKYTIKPTNDLLSKDLELAKKLLEEEERNFTKIIYTDEMLALTLQKEEMDDRLAPTDQNEGAASLIKKELDERLTEEQRRKKQEEEDFLMAQRLASGGEDVEQS